MKELFELDKFILEKISTSPDQYERVMHIHDSFSFELIFDHIPIDRVSIVFIHFKVDNKVILIDMCQIEEKLCSAELKEAVLQQKIKMLNQFFKD